MDGDRPASYQRRLTFPTRSADGLSDFEHPIGESANTLSTGMFETENETLFQSKSCSSSLDYENADLEYPYKDSHLSFDSGEECVYLDLRSQS